ncbi:hypothetical protein EYM_00800 [Ignicoccus islandicus DSM 13165]|uniref:Cytochrome C biogenesis protein transmembrane domain-containing protein n=1 Tax=Ignicoccus islandicus DSM 13165 TaxID=940295 RepID=A0A0U3FP91_9CREN|nr:hypothetical protein [Ignicoccus islandicus]ALU12143.1 hypothetical protein EYM_00800 [Ignicoccus islandicus DSM 13165]
MVVCSNVSVKALVTLINVTLLANNVTVYLIGVSNGPPCIEMKNYLELLSNRYGFKLVWLPIDKVGNVEPVPKVSELIERSGLPFQVPVSAVYCNDTLRYLVIGLVKDDAFWYSLMNCSGTSEIKVFYGEKLWSVVARNGLNETTINLVPLLVSMTIDSLNPVGLAVFSLLNAVYLKSDRKEYWKAVLKFVIAYSTAHIALGTMLAQVSANKIYSIIGIIAASIMIVLSAKPWRRLSKFFGTLSSKLSRMALSRASPVLIGIFASTIAMSPCVIGAYLSAISFVSSLPPTLRIPLFTLYAIVYSIPPLLVAFVSNRLAMKLNTRYVILVLATLSLLLSIYSLLS